MKISGVAERPMVRSWAVFGVIFLIWLTFCKPWFVDGSVIPYDAKNHFYAMIRFVAQSWHAGETAAWTPYHFGGFPLIADPQSVIWTPSLWPTVLFSAAPSMGFVDFVHLTHLLIIGFAIAAFGIAKGWHPVAAILAGLTAMMGGALTARLEHMLMTISVMWFTIALWRLELVVTKGGLWRGLAFALPITMMLFNRDHVAYLGAFFLLIYWIVQIAPPFLKSDSRGETVRKMIPVLAGGVVAILAAALPILMLLDLASNSNRPAFDLKEASWQSLHPVTMLTFVLPEYFGSLREGGAYWGPASRHWQEQDLQMHRGMLHYYLGTLPILVIFIVGLLNGFVFQRGARIFAAAAFLFYFYAIGRYTPFYEGLFHLVPGVDLFRRPADAIFLVGIATSLLTGFIVNQAFAKGRVVPAFHEIARRRVVTLFAVVAFVGFVAAWTAITYERVPPVLLSLLIFLVLGALLITSLNIAVKGKRYATLASVMLVAIAAGDLIFHTSGIRANTRPPTYYLQQAEPTETPVFNALSSLLEKEDATHIPYRVEINGLGATVQNIGQVGSFHDLLGYNPVRLASFETLIGPNMQNSAPRRRNFGTRMTGYSSKLFSEMGIKYIVTSVPLKKLDPNVDESQFKRLGAYQMVDRKAFIFENKDVKNRLTLEPRSQTDFVKAETYGHGKITIKASAEQPKRLVLRDFYYPGWRAWVNGKEVKIEKYDDLFRSVMIPAGESTITMRFQPFSYSNLKRILLTQLGVDDG